MNINKIIIGILILLLITSVASAANEVYLDPGTVYIPNSGSVTVEVRMNATDNIDTWSTRIAFNSTSVTITDVDFTGSITPNNASWGHHGDYIYLGGTELTAFNGNELLLTTLTIECLSICECEHDLEFTGTENIERLIAGPNVIDPYEVEIFWATWINGTSPYVPQCGDVNCDSNVNAGDYGLLKGYVLGAPVSVDTWAANVNCDANINAGDYGSLKGYVLGAPVTLNCCSSE